MSDGTIRNWSAEFAAYLSPGSQTAAPGEIRTFTADDLVILETVAALRQQNLSYTDIHQRLEKGERIEIDAPPIDVKPGQETAVTIAAFQSTLQNYETRLDKVQQRLEDEQAARLAAEIRATKAETELDILKRRRSFWQRLRGE